MSISEEEVKGGRDEGNLGPRPYMPSSQSLGPGSWKAQASLYRTLERYNSTVFGWQRGVRGFRHEVLVPHGHAITPAMLPSPLQETRRRRV
ncbi:uncharacterized protein PGTG_14474 [Puccinia graminis f. sp. tritici CRL 75-36-700-3]|uniref:Uncharacterized protein n=1 Tax=Puccinia graminis f. sp. tritici (strain CRL 75-36-700-3 / race SCCL) TaxID=418459 RepID=E3KVQ0_PUCGT|nr:uncharacterized protein PGTG_14474 [Puccinia graminis f. sp. tritici CRL 75-36-700-3]EFP88390.2 hypothetical protein PGTG_14474 [Puccinia graminis f. sp. tritici CRL 75-36-700-3]